MHISFTLSRTLPPFDMPVVMGPVSLASLPEDVLCLIAEHLNVSALCALARTCKRLRNFSLKPRVWTPQLRVTPKTNENMCRALYDFEASSDDEISILQGEVMKVIDGVFGVDDWITVQKVCATIACVAHILPHC